FYANGEVDLRYFSCYAREKERKERAIREQLSATRAEAERWKKQYEALRAEVESVAQELRKLAFSCAQDRWETGHPYHDGASDAYYEAGQMVRQLLAETGGDDQ